VNQIIPLGSEGGAGNLVLCEVLRIHINETVLDANGAIDQHKIDLVSRLGELVFDQIKVCLRCLSLYRRMDRRRCYS
jgi:flavin reductase (DIM6/NTAB) family NADH-FMN oxidoreductase RutF